jgi:hypothetical protein
MLMPIIRGEPNIKELAILVVHLILFLIKRDSKVTFRY